MHRNILDSLGVESIGQNARSSPGILYNFGKPIREKSIAGSMQEYPGI
jgi:hypothetical protein